MTRLAGAVAMFALGALLSGGTQLWAQPQARLAFIGVALDDVTRQADQRLTEYLYEKTGIAFSRDQLEYEQMIRRLVEWRPEDGPFLARMTP